MAYNHPVQVQCRFELLFLIFWQFLFSIQHTIVVLIHYRFLPQKFSHPNKKSRIKTAYSTLSKNHLEEPAPVLLLPKKYDKTAVLSRFFVPKKPNRVPFDAGHLNIRHRPMHTQYVFQQFSEFPESRLFARESKRFYFWLFCNCWNFII
jgi:hypothetical protein